MAYYVYANTNSAHLSTKMFFNDEGKTNLLCQ